MYCPAHFREERCDVLHELIRAHPLATLVSLNGDALQASHVPLMLHPDAGEHGVLRGHLARGNAQWRDASTEIEALAMFQGPHAYISPSWYPTKQETGKVVPTWNYAVVHCRGALRVHDDAEWLAGHVAALTMVHERDRAAPWAVEDAPGRYIETMVRGIVGIELEITAIDGKWKLSQNRNAADYDGVVEGLSGMVRADDRETAAIMRDLKANAPA
ncbi:FMN-binding negative transcriptional regulator [Breoghania sp. L-A4]|uniref:FMN-binding negative transcriptional regulator n=1 Tax=Breoghania sp. L-A4 TaxID=2304600 RepID=UPI000E35CC01|nr:FMN-binding negative transcriptional regulator [Breoghania sp. L-A4]AXS40523.1 FMN-binding negative transcriptional regulator [Breoghania sp. L-A4]